MNRETLLSDLRYKIKSFTILILEEGMKKKMRSENNKIVEKEENKNEKGDG